MPLYSPPIPRLVFKSYVPFIITTSGSIGNNGALTGVTALPQIYDRAYLYFPANAIVAGSAAGWYWTVMSSTTAGTIYNNVYDPTVGGEPQVPSSPTAFVTTGPGAFAQDVATGHQGPTWMMPVGTMGPDTRLEWEIGCRNANSANVKSVAFRENAVVLPGTTAMTSTAGANISGFVQMLGATARQVSGSATSIGGGGTTQTAFQQAIDLSVALPVNIFPLTSNVADWMVITHFLIWKTA